LNENVERASSIINHLREFGRKTDESFDVLDINVPLRNSASLLKTQLEAHNIEFILHLTDGLPKIRGNLNRLEQVFINLIINARDAVISKQRAENLQTQPPKQHRVMIESYLQDPKVVVTISDTGLGIPESLRSKVFEPFFTTKKTGQGTGLGLAISYGIVKEHNGSIEIINKPEPGCAIKLSFPRTSMG
jgi:C4-dicarboxylate-specific signal transduction histidine kinase